MKNHKKRFPILPGLSELKNFNLRLLLLLVLAVGCWNQGFSDTKFDISSSEIRNLRTNDGLSDLIVNEIYRDNKGFLYFGNGYGIDRFDGVRIVSFPAPGTNEQLKKINTITSDDSGVIYAGNGEGLLRLNPQTFTLDRLDPNILNFAVNQIGVIGDTLYMATNQCLFKKSITSGAVEHIHTAHTTFSELNKINGLTPSTDKKKIWLTGKGVLHIYDLQKGVMSTIEAPEPFDRTEFDRCLEIDGRLYLTTKVGELIRYDIKDNRFDTFAQFGRNALTSLGLYGTDKLYVSTDGNGLYLIDLATGEVLDHLNHSKTSFPQLSSNSIYSALIDDAGLLWLGYYQGGVDYSLFHRNTFDVYSDNLVDTNGMTVRAFFKDGNRMLIGTREGLYYLDKDRNFVKYYDPSVLRAEMVFAIEKYNGEYYIGTFGGGIHVVNPSTGAIRPFTPSNQKAEDWKSLEIFVMTVDKDGKLWIGSNKGAHCISGQIEERVYNSSNSHLPPGNIYEIYFDSKGTGWFCAEKGVAAYDGKQIYTDNIPKAFNRHNKYREVYEDSNGYLYFIPDRGPLVKTDLGLHKVETFKTPNRPESYWSKLNTMFAVEGTDHALWIGTTEGIKRINGIEARHFTNADGLPSPIFTLCKPVKDENGDIWFGNTAGLVKLSKEQSEALKTGTDTIVISQVLINGKDYTSSCQENGLKLKEGENNIQVLISDLSYSSPAYMMYEYQIEGSPEHTNWKLMQGISEISIYNLPQGDYYLNVRHVGVPSSTVSLPIHITRPFPWMLTLVIFCLVLIISLTIINIRHKRIARARELAEAEARAKAEAEAENQQQTPENEDDKKYKTMRLSDEECKRIVKKLDKIMKEEEPYRKPDLKIADLAEKVDTTPNALSFVFNIYLKSNYYDYINNYRIQTFKDMVAAVDLNKYTLSAISEKCGFSSRSSFFRSFKKATGLTPAEYIKSLDPKASAKIEKGEE